MNLSDDFYRLRLRAGTPDQWSAAGEVPLLAELVVIIRDGVDTLALGDGVTSALNLPALGSGGSGGTPFTLPKRLAEYSNDYTSGDLNNALANGWYSGSGMTNAPGTDFYYVQAQHVGDAGSYVMQTAVNAGKGTGASGLTYRRFLEGAGGWSRWLLIHDTNGAVDGVLRGLLDPAERVSPHGLIIGGSNLNDITSAGFYSGQLMTNAPLASTSYFYVLVQPHFDSNWCQQTATEYATSGGVALPARRTWTRQLSAGGAWSSWTLVADSGGAVDGPLRGLLTPFERLGTTAQDVSSTDVNALTNSGWYRGSSLTNSPAGDTGWFLEVRSWSSGGYVSQTATAYTGTPRVFMRQRQGAGAGWSAWVQIADANGAAVPGRLGVRTAPVTDANQALANGWYSGVGIANAPTGITGYLYLETIVHDPSGWVLQHATELANADASVATMRRRWTRQMQGGAWGTWVLENDAAGAIDSTARAATGSSGSHAASAVNATTINVDATKATTQVVTLVGNATVSTPSNGPSTGAFQSTLVLKQDATGGRTVTWPATILWPGATPPVLSTAANAVDRVQLTWDGQEWLGSLLGAAFARVPTAPAPTTRTFYNDSYTGTTVPAAYSRAVNNPTGGAVTVGSGAMTLATGSSAQWSGSASIFLGDPNHPEGVSGTGAPQIVSDGEFWWDEKPSDMLEQYQQWGFRLRNAELWPGGAGAGIFQTGYSLQRSVKTNRMQINTGYNAGNNSQIADFPFTFNAAGTSYHVIIQDKWFYLQAWTKGVAYATAFPDPTVWTFKGAILNDESDGSIGWAVGNGPDAVQKSIAISNLRSTTPVLSLGTTTTAPTTEKAGFTRRYTENFQTAAPAGTGASSFLNVYSASVQPYDEVSPNYQQRALLSAHDGVMDVAMNGTQGAAWVWGPVDLANSWIGGRFSMRAKALGAFGNGPAIMIWPSNNAWVEGEIDFPESVSGPGGFQGFQDPPWIHHHTMNTDHPYDQAAAQDVPLNVSWRDWHTYTAEWYPPGRGPTAATQATGLLIYYVDDVEVYRTQTDIPKTYHRFMGQVGAYGSPGNLYFDWVTMASLN